MCAPQMFGYALAAVRDSDGDAVRFFLREAMGADECSVRRTRMLKYVAYQLAYAILNSSETVGIGLHVQECGYVCYDSREYRPIGHLGDR